MDSRDVLARFGVERRALELMDHVGVARVLDAGATAESQPYFAMEYVKGEPPGAHPHPHEPWANDRSSCSRAITASNSFTRSCNTSL